ncbi:molybdenum cofactor biosynthesis protein MoaE [Brevundimonas sp. AAP58]|uniref:molybdenum cofactor biosynthesis protein MoaE n=1 Tax=Brevundimonas sp. AAP58 TaxID=1523422 RepID=UPI0006B974D3|nr:molybdenum cofactor biosynthesis protein MoaE [Brevundimonas sp. AAP58]
MIEVTAAPLDPSALLAGFTRSRASVGAIVSFTGLTRAGDADFPVAEIVLESYPGVTERTIQTIVDGARRRFDVEDIHASHRIGAVPVGEPVVFVAVAAAHRRAAFDAADFVMDHLKSRAAFWKKEVGPKGSRWVEPRAQDLTDLDRWTGDAP